ncbi:unnamed protein product [Moneuplotes crassus]|uniref:Kinesin motor domain-containing protein n=1 Tax=Euplotes crassus TaxID=5936 RepID=A0AAD1XY92_EUPCR|nr:unnamed protein product [Moneuplotes crassus]
MEETKGANLSMSDAQTISNDDSNIKAICRFRPLTGTERGKGGSSVCCELDTSQNSVSINLTKKNNKYTGPTTFSFDRVFDLGASQRDIYEAAAEPIINSVLQGFNGTILTYGQSGSGKTFTMHSSETGGVQNQGILPRIVSTLFSRIENMTENIEFSIKISMLEIFQDKICDLLEKSKVDLQVKQTSEKGTVVENLTEKYIGSSDEIYDALKIGDHLKTDKSHVIFIMNVDQTNADTGSGISGKLILADLAGTEKNSSKGSQGSESDDMKGIEKSLSILRRVTNALAEENHTDVPYQDSKLTQVLSESFGGNTKTSVIITCSPSPWHELETMSSLRFGSIARTIKNTPKINKLHSQTELSSLLNAAEVKISALDAYITQNNLPQPKIPPKSPSAPALPNHQPQSTTQPGLSSFIDQSPDQEALKTLEQKLAQQERTDECLKTINRLKEDIQVLEGRIEVLEEEKLKVELEKEGFMGKNSLMFKLQGSIDLAEERHEIIKLQEEKIKVKDKEVEVFKEKVMELMVKLKKYENDKAPGSDPKEITNSSIRLKKEIMALRHIMNLKDEILSKLKLTEDLTDEDRNKIIINTRMLEEIEKASSKYTKIPTKMVLVKETDTDTLSLSESEVEQIVINQKMIHARIEEELATKRSMRKEIEDIKYQDEDQLTKEVVQAKMNEMKESFDKEREHLLSDLGNRTQKVKQLEMELEIQREEYKKLEKSLTEEEFSMKIQIEQLQRQVDQMNLMYHHEVSSNNVLKVDVQLYEKKILKRDQRIATLEKSYKTLSEQAQEMKSELMNAQKQMIKLETLRRESLVLSRIPTQAKMIKRIKTGVKPREIQKDYRNKIVERVIGDPFNSSE